MRKINPLSIIKNRQGISLIFVLAFMLLLLMLGVSALTAAGLSFRAVLRQQMRNQGILYMESMNLVVQSALDDDRPGEETMTEIILSALYEAFI